MYSLKNFILQPPTAIAGMVTVVLQAGQAFGLYNITDVQTAALSAAIIGVGMALKTPEALQPDTPAADTAPAGEADGVDA